jgi:hypothetical protein
VKSHQDVVSYLNKLETQCKHYSYRKIVSPSPDKLLPESKFQLYAVSTSYPQKLLGSEKDFGKGIKKVKAGIYKISSPLVGSIIILVLSQMSLLSQNALWQLFSGNAEGFEYGDAHYKWHSPEDKSLLNQLYLLYLKEGVDMPYTFEDFHRDYTMPFIESLPPEVRLKGIPPEVRLKGIPPEEVFKQFSPDEVFKQFTPDEVFKQFTPDERLKGLAPDERLKGLTPSEIEAYLLKLKKETH